MARGGVLIAVRAVAMVCGDDIYAGDLWLEALYE